MSTNTAYRKQIRQGAYYLHIRLVICSQIVPLSEKTFASFV